MITDIPILLYVFYYNCERKAATENLHLLGSDWKNKAHITGVQNKDKLFAAYLFHNMRVPFFPFHNTGAFYTYV